MTKRKTVAEQIAAMPISSRVELAKKLTDRVADHILYVLELHETNRIVLYSPALSSQIPKSRAGIAFQTFQRGLHQIEIVRLCALWDSPGLAKENIPTVIELIDHPDVIDALAHETASHYANRPIAHMSGLPNEPESRELVLEAIRKHEQDFGNKQASSLRRDLDTAIAGARSIVSSATHASVRNLRDKHLAHSLSESWLEQKAGFVDPMKYGDERVMLEASLRIATALMCWTKGASFDFEESRGIYRRNAEALWLGCTFNVKS